MKRLLRQLTCKALGAVALTTLLLAGCGGAVSVGSGTTDPKTTANQTATDDQPENKPEDKPAPKPAPAPSPTVTTEDPPVDETPPNDDPQPDPDPLPSLSQSALTACWANTGENKVTRDELRASQGNNVTNSAWDGTTVNIFGAKNEVVNVNLVLEARTTTVQDIVVSLTQLTGPNGETIASVAATGDDVFRWIDRPIELFYVRYLPINGLSKLFYENYYDERHVPQRLRRPWTGSGVPKPNTNWVSRPDHDKFYPDIAVPLETVPHFDVAAGQNQSIWIDIAIPKSAPSGLYTGNISITEAGAETRRIPVQLAVRNFTLPDTPSAKTMLFVGYQDINTRYLASKEPWPWAADDIAQSRLVRDRHFALAHRHRISLIDSDYSSPGGDAPSAEWAPRLDGSLFTAANGYDGPGAGVGNNIYSIGTYGQFSQPGGWLTQGQTAIQTHSNNWVNWFATNAPSTEYFLYLIDESSDYASIEQWANWINTNPGVGKNLRSMATMPIIDAAANTPSLDIPTSPAMVGVTSTWQTAVDQYAADANRRVYYYNSRRPISGTFAIEDDGVALRELAWSQYKKTIDRWYYWESTYYNNYQGGLGQTNVFQNAQTFGGSSGHDAVQGDTGWNYGNGDGVLFYPGTDHQFPSESYGLAGPLASLRLKLWRRGIQDVDYLTMAAAKNPAAVQTIVNQLIPKVLWEVGVDDPNDPTYVHTDISWPTDPDVWETARKQLADIIEQ